MSAYPPPGQAGPPPAGYGTPRAGFDPKSVNPLDWATIGAAVLALIFSFFSYYSYAAKGSDADEVCKHLSDVPAQYRGQYKDVCDGVGNSAWHGFFGWFGVLLALIAAAAIAVAIFAPHISLPVPARLVGIGGLALGVIFTLIALAVVPDGDYKGTTIDSGASDVDAGHGWAYWLVLILLIILRGPVMSYLYTLGVNAGVI